MTGLVAALAATTMLFAALSSAYIVRRGLSNDWIALSLPITLYLSVLPGLAVSVLTQLARRRAAAVFAILFAAMLAEAWHQPLHQSSAAFFFVIRGVFYLYVIGGIVALLAGARLPVIGWYWHYLNALWILLLAFLFLWR